MAKELIYTKDEQKELGAFYTPEALSDLLAYYVLSMMKKDKSKEYTVVDPSVGDSALLLSFLSASKSVGIKTRYLGIDIEKCAINKSKELFVDKNVPCVFVKTDGLYPYNSKNPKNPKQGWSVLKQKYMPQGVNIFVSNPPWGAEKDKYKSLSLDFRTAKGQFDIYDLFIETIINNLVDGGYYGIIVPDSIYSEEHKPIREILLKETTLKRIIRLGEGFFPGVNIAVSIIMGIKKISRGYKVVCSHLSNEDKKRVLSNELSLQSAVKDSECKIPVKLMIDSNYSFLTDIRSEDVELMGYLRQCPTIGQFTTNKRGIELSKKGTISQCPVCGKWFPEPKGKMDVMVKCHHCNSSFLKSSLSPVSIISDQPTENSEPLIVGETIYRYNSVHRLFIKKDIDGINYKDNNLYASPKILVRKTGVGITAGIDYKNCFTNQVVYIFKRKNNINEAITNEVILAILNSRLITYFIIMTLGSTGWKTHPYMSQKTVSSLPFPIVDTRDEQVTVILNNITNLVRNNSNGESDNFPTEIDAQIERYVAELFHLGIEHYNIIFNTIQNVQKMIPFKRLLQITPKMIFNNGI